MNWTLGRIALSLLGLAAVLIMCAGYAGVDALLGTAVIVGALGFAFLIVRALR